MSSYLNSQSASDPNSAVGNTGAQLLIANIQDTRQMLASLSLPKTIPVGNSDAGAYFNNLVLGAIDYGVGASDSVCVRRWPDCILAVQCPPMVRKCLNRHRRGLDSAVL